MRATIEGGRYWTGSGLAEGPVHIDGDRWVATAPDGAARFDATGLVALPSWVDLAVELCDPGYLWRETLQTGSRAAAAGGFGLVVASPATDPVIDRGALLADLLERARKLDGARVAFAGALTEGLQGEQLAELGMMVEAGAVALSDGGHAVADTLVLRRALDYARPFDVPVVLRPGDAFLETEGVVHEGAVSLRVGLRGIPAAAEEIGVARIVALVRQTGAVVHIHGVSTARAIEQVCRAQDDGLAVTASVPARNLLLTDRALVGSGYNTHLRVVPPLRPEADRAACVAAVRAGRVCVTSAHVPMSRVEKELELERAGTGSAGLETAMAATLTALDGDVEALVHALCTSPSAVVGRAVAAGPGSPAELVWVDLDAQAVAGAPMESLGVGDALSGCSLVGRVVATMVGGNWVTDGLLGAGEREA